MKKYQLGEFEEIVMLTVGILHLDAYGVSIKKEIESRLKRGVSVGALQTALKRLEDKGYLKSREGEATEERAGRPKKYFQITALGKRAMEHTKKTREELWSAIPKIALAKLQVSTFSFRALQHATCNLQPVVRTCSKFFDTK
jgi:PadR family transcriptional regulator PadR